MNRRGTHRALTLSLALLLGSCERTEEPEVLQLLRFSQEGVSSVYLNEELVFQFSDVLDPASVTSATVRVVDDGGRPAEGRLLVERSVVTFAPELPLSADLTDGGFRPDTFYTVQLAGFPRPDGIRARSGAPLIATRVLTFRTVRGGDTPRFFLDQPSPRLFPLGVRSADLGPLDPIALECGEAIDPTTLSESDFGLYPLESTADPEKPPAMIRLEPRLIQNRADLARLELWPAGSPRGLRPVLREGSYLLLREGPGFGLRNLGGRVIQVAWPGLARRPPLVVHRRIARLLEVSFRSSSQRGQEPLPLDCDGTAHWPDRGPGLSLRYPAAAGDGHDGVLDLRTSPDAGPVDLQTTRLRIPAGAEVELGAVSGMILLRSQGALEVAGRLARKTEPTSSAPTPITEELLRALSSDKRDTLSGWLERARATEEPWTVLIAGGDLFITGEIDVGGPLVLIAGGHIRSDGSVDAEEVWHTPEGRPNVRARDHAEEIPLRIDPPTTNPLREPFRAAAFSVPLRPARDVASWQVVSVDARNGRGSTEIAFLGLKDRGDRIEVFGPVTDISLLDGCAAIRALVRLEVLPAPGEDWDPPVVERLELRWSLPAGTGLPDEPE